METTNKYRLIRVNGELIYEHRYKMQIKMGRKLLPKEQVHHKNGVRSDNRLNNLVLCKDIQEHRLIHLKAGRMWGAKKSDPCFCGKPSHGKNLCKNHYAQTFRKEQGW